MTIRTSKGGRDRYHTCSIKARQGETGCLGGSIAMEKLDTIVAGHIEDRLLQHDQLEEVLAPRSSTGSTNAPNDNLRRLGPRLHMGEGQQVGPS